MPQGDTPGHMSCFRLPLSSHFCCSRMFNEESPRRRSGEGCGISWERRPVIWWHLGSTVIIKQVAFAHKHIRIQFISWRGPPGEPY